MKQRTGFVSNSSSSSFIITTSKPLNKADLTQVFGVPKTSPMFQVTDQIADWFVNNSEKVSLRQYLEETCWDDDDLPPIIADAVTNKKHIYMGSAADDNGGIEYLICDLSLNFISTDFSIEKEGSY